MIEIRFHGRGGHGAVTAAKVLALAAAKEDKFVLAYPFYGVERRGAPVTAFARIDDRPVRERAMIKNPDVVVIFDETLVLWPSLLRKYGREKLLATSRVNVLDGLKKDGLVVLNTKKAPSTIKKMLERSDIRIATVDATSVSIKYGLGTAFEPIPNMPMLGALVKATNIVSLDTALESAKEIAPGRVEQNLNAIKEAYENTVVGE